MGPMNGQKERIIDFKTNPDLMDLVDKIRWDNLKKYPKTLDWMKYCELIFDNSQDKVHTCSKKVIYFCLPFTGHHGLQIRSQLQKFLSSAYPHISLRVVFRPSFRLSNFFPFKDKIPCELRSHVVYLYKCQCCGALYVG